MGEEKELPYLEVWKGVLIQPWMYMLLVCVVWCVEDVFVKFE